MTARHALVVHTRMPAFDRDSGSQDIDNTVGFLLDAGWRVTFLSQEEDGVAEERHARRLRQMGVATYAGFGWAERVLRSNRFDLAIIAFWELAAELLPLVRARSPRTRVIVNSIDVHFLRHARRTLSADEALDATFGTETTEELNTYHAADGVITVSEKERDFLAELLGTERVHAVPLAESIPRSTVPLPERRGMFFVGNFRHLPNREAVEYLGRDVLPLLDPALLARHPLSVVGNWLEHADLDLDPTLAGVELVGWVPSVRPYVERARISVVPLLHGAGVKRKVIQSMMAYTPVVTTPVGAEGLDLVQGEHALVAVDAADFAAGVTRLLTDDDLWSHVATRGADHVDARHGEGHVRRCFLDVVDRVVAGGPRATAPGTSVAGASPLATEIRHRIATLAAPGAPVLVASRGDEELADLGPHEGWHFPEAREGGWAGYEPVDGPAAVNHLDAQRGRGAAVFVLPRPAFGWRRRYPELIAHLERTARRIHDDEHMVVYDLAGPSPVALLDPPDARVLVRGTYAAERTGPPPALVAELERSETLTVTQRWSPAPSGTRPPTGADTETGAEADHDYVVELSDRVVLPGGFLDELLALHRTLDVERLQPALTAGTADAPPITLRQRGTVARELDAPTPIPVLSRRTGASAAGPTTLTDSLTVGLREPLPRPPDDLPSAVRRLWVLGRDGRPVGWTRAEPVRPPRISVLVSTFERPELLRECLAAFADQTLDRDEFEVVVVDDGSTDAALDPLLEKYADRLQLVGVRIDHAGRSAAKNLCVVLARAPIVLFFDDDDRPEADYLERHLARHAVRPEESVAVLGHTDWAPELVPTPLMHYVTDVDRLMFAYERLEDGQELDWRGFWEGRISCKRSLLVRHALHDQRLEYSIDVEMAWRLAPTGLRVLYDAGARSVMARPLDFPAFCARTEAKGRAHRVIAELHPGTTVAERLMLGDARAHWEEHGATEPDLLRRVARLERQVAEDPSLLPELHETYRRTFRLLHAKGAAGATGGTPTVTTPPTTVTPFPGTDPALASDGTPAGAPRDPQVTVTIPVWSRTPELADMARRTIDRVWEVARVPTEVVVVDNGSPHEVPLAAKVHRYPENKGVATGWNTGIRLASAPMVVVLNSDCRVEPGWDEALYEAASDGRRVAFPYTDHCDGLGFVQPDQGGTAGWCFMMSKRLYDEVGPFDEWFNPAFCEDTDYWHRAWELGVELSPVPAARVVHARRTTASSHPHVDWLLQGHRYKYGWKHGVDPHRAPPYYNRDIVEYHGRVRPPAR